MKITIYFDGSCQPINPGGRAGFGWIAYQDGKCIGQNYGFIGEGEGMSCNVAEYHAIISAMEWVGLLHPASAVEFCGDSNLVINQMSGKWKIKRGLYASAAFKAMGMRKSQYSYRWIPREQNEEADALSQIGSAA